MHKQTFSVVLSNLKRVDLFNNPPLPPLRDKGKNHPLRSEVKPFFMVVPFPGCHYPPMAILTLLDL